MNFKNLAYVVGFVSLLAFSLPSGSRVLAANPNFSRTAVLSPHEGQTLYDLDFSDNSVFTKLSQPRSSSRSYWTPTATDVIQAQEALWKYTALGADIISPGWDQFQLRPHTIVLTTDLRQYAGITVNGKEYILIVGSTACGNNSTVFNARDVGEYQQNRFPHLTDGGSPFQAVHNPVSHQVEYLIFDHFVEKKSAMFTL